jgi:hypothetical protein
MRFRKLRIAWSVACAIACVLLIVLWVRSYWWVDWCQFNSLDGYNFEFVSASGAVQFGVHPARPADMRGWLRESKVLAEHPMLLRAPTWILSSAYSFINMPHWFLLALVAAAIAIPWINWPKHFSLRTLLIATTLVAVVLGATVWLIR